MDFKVDRGLRQGDSLSPYHFVIIVEGLSSLIRNASDIEEFEGFSVQKGISVDIIQFADDTLLIGAGCWKNLWIMKVILKGFKLVSGLGINYHKSKLIGINVSNHFLLATSNFLACKLHDSNI